MRVHSRTKYNRYDKKKTPFLQEVDDVIMNGHWDVTETKEHLEGIKTGDEEIRLKDYLVYRPLPKALLAFQKMPEVHPQSYEMQEYYKDIMTLFEEGLYVGNEYFNPMFCFWVIMFRFEIPCYDSKGNKLDGSEIGKPLYSTIDRYIFDCIWKGYKLREYIAFMGGRGIGKSYITDAVLAWYYILFDKQEIIVSATSDPIVEEAWGKVVSTIKMIEEDFPGIKQKQQISSTKKIVACEEFYDSNHNLQERGSLNEIRRITYADNPNVTRGRRPHFQHIEEFASFPSHPGKGSLKNCLGQSKGSWRVMGSFKKAFVILTGTGGSVNNKDAEDVFTNPRASNILPINEWGKETGIFIPAFLKYGGTWEPSGTPDIGLSMRLILASRKDLESDPVLFMQELQEFPITLEEVFTVKGFNIFNQDKIAESLAKLKMLTKKPWREGRLDYIYNSGKEIIGVQFVEMVGGKIIVIEEPDREADGKVKKGLYVSGVDSIDQGRNDSLGEGSMLACAVKKRFTDNIFAATSNLYVCFYNERSNDVRYDYENVLKIAMWYNAKINLEYTKINIVSYFREKKQFFRFLQRPSIAIGSNVSGAKASQLIGSPATASVIGHQDQKLADYINDYCYQILYIPALEQSRDYDANNRTKFDLIVAMGLAELADEEMLGKPATDTGEASSELTMFGMYRDRNGRKRWGEIPSETESEITSIAEEAADEIQNGSFQWVDNF